MSDHARENGPALAVRELRAAYGPSHILRGVSLTVPLGGVLALLGRNGAGKTTTLRAIMGLIADVSGDVFLSGQSLAGVGTPTIVRCGMTLVLEDRGVFPSLTVRECLALAARRRGAWTVERVTALFPRLAERLAHGCGQLSGGEQQMLAIGRALLLDPKVLLLDEPTQGLAPIIVKELLESLLVMKKDGVSMLLVEQNIAFATQLADRVSVLGRGVTQWSGGMEELSANKPVMEAWLGV